MNDFFCNLLKPVYWRGFRKLQLACLFSLVLIIFFSCLSGTEVASINPKDNTSCNPNATEETNAILRYIAALSEEPFSGAISGQSCGHVNNIYNPKDLMGFQQQAGKVFKDTGEWPAIIAVDYGHDRIYAPDELSAANKVLIDYWNSGGLVAVGFSPINPWRNDESDLSNQNSSWKDSYTIWLSEEEKREIDLNKLIDPNEDIHKVWRKKLDRIADALQELEDAGVTVLFKPMQEHNGNWFWWGIESHRKDPTPYINLYRDLYNYFTYTRGLNNILWLYSPDTKEPSPMVKPVMWNYPGDDFIDIIAPTAYGDNCQINGYKSFVETGKPLGMAEYGPDYTVDDQSFDNSSYIKKIEESYPGIAFWISWHDWSNGDGTYTYESIGRNQKAYQLMNDPRVITREKLQWNNPKSKLVNFKVERNDLDARIYKVADGRELQLHIFYPEGYSKTSGKKYPVAASFHGGAWTMGTVEWGYGDARFMASLGYVGIAVEYRLADNDKNSALDCMKDANSAIRWIRLHAEELNIDPEKVTALGHSAGGHLSLSTALFPCYKETSEDYSVSSVPNSVIGLAPAIDLSWNDFFIELLLGQISARSCSPIDNIRDLEIPILIIQGTEDEYLPVEKVIEFHSKMKKAGNNIELHLYPGGNHGFFYESELGSDFYQEKIRDFIQNNEGFR